MREEESPCEICGTNYIQSRTEVRDDSHHYYSVYNKCPNCRYNSRLNEEICEILNEKMKIRFVKESFRKGYSDIERMTMDVNFDELKKLILSSIKKNWPKPRRGKK